MRDAIVDKMNGYVDAWRALDPERLASFYTDDPAFRVYNDGHVYEVGSLFPPVPRGIHG